MNSKTVTLDEVMTLAVTLPAADRVRLIERLASSLYGNWIAREDEPSRSMLGALAHLGPAPSAEEIDEVRREMWGEYMREEPLA